MALQDLCKSVVSCGCAVIDCVFVSLVGYSFLLDATVAYCKYFHAFRTRLTTAIFENSCDDASITFAVLNCFSLIKNISKESRTRNKSTPRTKHFLNASVHVQKISISLSMVLLNHSGLLYEFSSVDIRNLTFEAIFGSQDGRREENSFRN